MSNISEFAERKCYMKREFDTCPKSINEDELYGFSWMEHVAAVPSPLVVVTTYKSNGLPNATMQSWCTFVGEEGYHCIFSSVNKYGHMYKSLKETGCCVINFPSKDCFLKCIDTIKNNGFDNDEITMSGLTPEIASKINAPRIKECFLNLECELEWEKDLSANGTHAVMCLKVVNVCMDEKHYNENKIGRYGESGYLYNIHSPRNPETGEISETYVGTLTKYATYEEL